MPPGSCLGSRYNPPGRVGGQSLISRLLMSADVSRFGSGAEWAEASCAIAFCTVSVVPRALTATGKAAELGMTGKSRPCPHPLEFHPESLMGIKMIKAIMTWCILC